MHQAGGQRTKAGPQARVDLAAGYFRNGQMAVALEEARRAVQIDPTFADAYGLLGLIYMELDDRREAEANFQRALQLAPANPDINNNYGWFLCQHRTRARSDRLLPACAARSAVRHSGARQPQRRAYA